MSADNPMHNPADFDLTPEEQRLALINQRVFDRAVTKATEQATQNVSQVHRRRLVMQSAVLTAVIMAALGIAIIVFVSNNNGAQAQADSKYNCQIFSHVADDMSQFVQTDANLRTRQQLSQAKIATLHPGALRSLFTDPETVRLSKESAIAEKDTVHFWNTYIAPDLRNTAAVNCVRSIH